MTKAALLLLAAATFLAPTAGQAGEGEGAAGAERDTLEAPASNLSLFPPRMSRGDLVFLPTFDYSSENGAGFGVQVARTFGGGNEIEVKGEFTSKSRKKGEVSGDFQLAGGRYHLKTKAEYSDYRRRYWGVGADTPSDNEEIYVPHEVRAYLEFSRRVVANLDLGLRYEYESMEYEEVKEGGLLAAAGYPCDCEHDVMGAGIIFDWDTRDRRHSPTSGVYYQGFALIFEDELGSGVDFNNTYFDLRNYTSLRPGHVLATQLFFYGAGGGVPLWRLAELGGRAHTRGYRRARYRDRTLLAAQLEYRLDLVGRLGMVGFAGVGEVAPALDRMGFRHVRPTLGAGLRYRLSRRGHLKARLDGAVGESSARAYFGLDEAF